MSKSEGLTREQHDLCYEIQFAIMREIVNLDHEKIWELIQKAIEGKDPTLFETILEVIDILFPGESTYQRATLAAEVYRKMRKDQ